MSQQTNGFSKYRQQAVETASKEKVLIMLYEAAIKNLKLAKKALEEKRIAEKGTYLGKCHDIISELVNSLNHKQGGEIAGNLEALYIYLLSQLTQANIKNDIPSLDRVISILETLLDGWTKAIENLRKDKKPGA